MNNEVYRISDYFPQIKNDAFESTLTCYCPDNTNEIQSDRKRVSIIICPGGGYSFTSAREAEPVALHFVSRDFTTFVLRYSCAPARYPQALLELSAAVALVRRNAAKFNADPDKIAVCGFSAGGHLACSLGVFWNQPFLAEKLQLIDGENKPNAMILGYPVITSGQYSHEDSMLKLLGPDASPELRKKMSLEDQVGKQTPPAFIWHTFDDGVVPVQNTLLLATALRDHNVPFGLHIFTRGPHGLSLCDFRTCNGGEMINPNCAVWVDLCENWLKQLFSFSYK